MDTSITLLLLLLITVVSPGDLDLLWLMRCHTNKLIILVKDSKALHLLQCTSVLFHVVIDNDATYTQVVGPSQPLPGGHMAFDFSAAHLQDPPDT